MADNSQWAEYEEDQNLPACYCCEDTIRQRKALHIFSGRKRVWMCDRCIEDFKELTGFDKD